MGLLVRGLALAEPAEPRPALELKGKTEQGLYQITAKPKTSPVQIGPFHEWVLTVVDSAGKPVTKARVAVGGGMPGHGHGLPTQPKVTRELKPGEYLVEGMKFNMAGAWVLTFAVDAASGRDRIQFEFKLDW